MNELINSSDEGKNDTDAGIKIPLHPLFQRTRINRPLDIIQITFGTIFLVPFRFLAMLALIILGWILAHLVTMFRTSEEIQTQPISEWRRALRWFAGRLVMRTFYFCSGFYWVKVKGVQASGAEAPIIVVGPHSSFFDSLPLLLCNGIPSVIVRAETQKEVFNGTLMEMIQAIFVSRESHESRSLAVKAIQDRVGKIMKSDPWWPQLYIYPEGTTGNRSCFLAFKKGAFIPGVPVQPLVIRYPHKMDTISFTFDGLPLYKSFWLTLSQFINYCEMEFLPVYTPNEEEKHNPVLFAKNVQQVMAKALDIPITDYTYEDGIAMEKLNVAKIVSKLNAVASFRKNSSVSPLVELNAMRNIALNKTNDCMVTKGSFIQDLSIINPNNTIIDIVDKLFSILKNQVSKIFQNQEDPLTIDEREYLIYASILNPVTNIESVIQTFFMMYTQGRKEMSSEEFQSFINRILCISNNDAIQIFNTPQIQDSIDLELFTKKVQKRLIYLKLLSLEILGLIQNYPPGP